MRLTILTSGTRGDVQPYVALGTGLRDAGHAVTLVAPHRFESLVRRYDLNYRPLNLDADALLADPAVQREAQGRNFLRMLSVVQRTLGPRYPTLFADYWAACQDSDAIIASGTSFGAFSCAEKLGVPFFLAALQPFPATREFPSFFLPPGPRLGGAYNWLSHLAFQQVLWLAVRDWENDWRRQELGLPALPFWLGPYGRMAALCTPMLFGYSPLVVPKPVDWKPWHHVTGYWFLGEPPSWSPPDDLVRFLEAGPPPVYVGFGSMSSYDGGQRLRLAITALQRLGLRGVIQSDGADMIGLPDGMMTIGDAPHRWLFSRMAALVHHGGAGTTGAALATGVPSLVIPVVLDQFAWGERIAHIQATGTPLPGRRISASSITIALDYLVSDSGVGQKVVELAARLKKEDGVGSAASIVGGIAGGL